ncbi:hypothetical protein ACLB2K_045358 [Fragaria x ananassa]
MDQTNNDETNDSPPESESGWAELTHDCLTNIITRLSLKYRWRAMLICKSWLLACKNPHLNSGFVLVPNSVPEATRWLAPRSGERSTPFSGLLLNGARGRSGRFAPETAQMCPSLLSLKGALTLRSEDRVSEEADAIGKSMPNLKYLELRFSKVTASGIGLIYAGCRKLEYLDVFGCENLTRRVIDNAMSELPNLKEIRKPYFYTCDIM